MLETQILAEVVAGRRMNAAEAKFLWEEGSWTRMAEAAQTVRERKLGATFVGYTAFRLVNYTNVCDVDCSFCSFQEEVGSGRGYVLDLKEIQAKALEAKAQGADQIFFQGGVNTAIPLEYYLEALQLLSHEMGMHVRGFSPIELVRMSEVFRLPMATLLGTLKEAGLGSVPGAGAEILGERMRAKLSPLKLPGQVWSSVMGECHLAGLPGSANIVFGSDESSDDIVEHLCLIRDQQDRTGGFLTFVPWVFQPQTKRFFIRHVRGDEYLKMLALSRLWFDNIDHIEVSLLVLGKELGELGLHSGADDINSIVLEENVLRSKGLQTLRAAERFIVEAGFTPRRRTLNYDSTPYEGQARLWPPVDAM